MARRTQIETIRAFDCHYAAIATRLSARAQDGGRSGVHERVFAELARAPGTSSSKLARRLVMDKGQLSRALSLLVADDMVVSGPAGGDSRVRALWLTEEGEREAARLEELAAGRIGLALAGINTSQHGALAAALGKADAILSSAIDQAPVVLGNPMPGDLGELVSRHGEIGASEFGYDARYEGWVAGLLAEFVAADNDDEQIWIARVNGVFAGAIVATRSGGNVAEFGLLLVEPEFRGQGIAMVLVESALAFAKEVGYTTARARLPAKHKPARRLFARTGFARVGTQNTNWLGQKRSVEIFETGLKAPINQA